MFSESEGANNTSEPSANSRPLFAEGQVIDPSKAEIKWDRSKPRNGQWDMGHKPGQKYSDMHDSYMNDLISLDEFLEWYRDAAHYRPELPSTNRSHWYE